MFHQNTLKSLDRRDSPGKGGFSLIELVFAMLFLTIIILGVVNLQTSNLAMMNGQQNQIQAHFLAKQGLQVVRPLAGTLPVCDPAPCDKLIKDYKLENQAGGSSDWEKITAGTQTFQRRIRISSKPEGLEDAVKVTAIVEWEDSTGKHGLESNSQVEASMIVAQ